MKLKIESLLDLYKSEKKTIIYMPIMSVVLVITAVILMIKMQEIWWLGLIFFGLAIIPLVAFVVLRKIFDKKIKELEETEAIKNAKD